MSKSENTQTFCIFMFSGWEAEDISKLTNLESNSVVFNKVLVAVFKHSLYQFLDLKVYHQNVYQQGRFDVENGFHLRL